ncbi:MAG TPA: hypothetical protein VGD80_39420 [Kofleriaceae bacterium]
MTARVHIPVRLIVEPDALRGGALADLEARIGEELAKTWQLAQRELAADRFVGAPRLAATSFDWTGPGQHALEDVERRSVEQRLRKVLQEVAAVRSPATRPPRAWLVHPPLRFRARFDRFVELVRAYWHTGYALALAGRAGENYAGPVDAAAWVIDVVRAVPLPELLRELTRTRAAVLGAGPYLLFRSRAHAERLRALHPRRLARLPALDTDEPVYPPGVRQRDVLLTPGMRLIFAAAAEPAASTVPLVRFAARFSVAVRYMDLLAVNLPDPGLVAQKFGDIDRSAFLELYAGWSVTVRVLPFTVERPIDRDLLRAMASALASRDEPAVALFARLFRFASDSLDSLPTEIATRAIEWIGGDPARTAAPAAAREWQAGERGLFVVPVLTDMAERVRASSAVQQLRGEARELAHIVLELKDGFWSADRLDALRRFLLRWYSERPKLIMEVIFAELDRLGAFTALFAILLDDYAWHGWMLVTVIGNVTGTSFEHRPEVQLLIDRMNQIRREQRWQITWDPATSELVFVHSRRRVKAAGANNPDPGAGVIGEVSSYFTTTGAVSRPTKATIERLAEPTRRHLQQLMLDMLCKPGETRTREELIGQAVNAAAAELKLDPERDLERVKVTFSCRVIAIERRTEHGLDAVYVTLEPVQRFGDGGWENAGPIRPAVPLGQLDAELTSIHVEHEKAVLTVFFLAETLVAGGAYIIITGGWLGLVELVVAVSIREALYVWGTSAADRDPVGYLTQALFGVVDVLGFRVGARLGAQLAGRVITSRALAAASTRWILYATKGLAVSSVLGATQVVEKFADDLLHLTHCRRWSSPLEYLEEFGKGFVAGLLCEFVLAPVLSVAARIAIRALANRLGLGAKEAVDEIAKHVPADEVAGVMREGVDNLEGALVNTFKPEKSELVRQIVAALRKQVDEIVEHVRAVPEPKRVLPRLRAEWSARAVDELLAAAEVASKGEVKLGAAGKAALEHLARTTSTRDMNAILETVLRAPRLRAFLDTTPKLGEQLLGRAFRAGPDELELFLRQFGKFSPEDAAATLASLLRIPRLSVIELNLFGQLVERVPGELAAFLKVATVDELRALLRLAARNPLIARDAASELLRLGATRPQTFNEVVAALGERLQAGEPVGAAAIREAIIASERKAAEETVHVQGRLARKSVTPEKVSQSIEKDVRYGERKEELTKLTENKARVAADLEKARIEQERYEIMKHGDPAHGGERRPLAFTTWKQYEEFKDEFAKLVDKLADGRQISAQGQVIGSSTSFYSGNPDKPLGHYFDRRAPYKMGDVDVDLCAPELAKDMLASGAPAMNEKVLVGGERIIFKNEGPGGVYTRFSALEDFNDRWSSNLGREVAVKLRVDLELPPKPTAGPIEFFRKEAK